AAANALKTAKTGAEVSDALATLATACANYIEKNGGKIFKSNRRKQVVRTLLEQLSDYENALSQNEMKQTGDNVPDALYWNGKEIKKTVFKEIQLLSSEKNEQPENDRIPAERFNAAYGEESAVPGFEDDAVLHMREEELDGEAQQRLDLSRHLAAEREKLIHRRRSIRNIIEPRISKTRMIGTAEMFRTAEDKEALREWTLREKDGKNKGKYGFNWSLIDYSDNSVWSYSEILRTVQEAPIDEFLDEDDGDFASSFAEKYDRLCKYASADVILRITEEKAGNTHISNSQGFSVSEVIAKIKFFKEMREQYEDRLRLLSSPYYITQKAGDMAKYLGEEGEKEKEKVEDQKLLSYITLYQKVCGSDLALGKGKETKDHYKALLEESRKEQLKRDEEKVKDAFRRLKEGKAAEEAYKKEHAPQELVLSEEDAQLEKSEKQIELFNRQKALYLTGYPEDDVEFVKQIGVEVGGDLILGMDVNELNSMEKIFIEDILLNGKAGGMDIDHALLDELKGMIHDIIHVRREFIAECYAADFTCNMAEGMGIDLNNPLAEGSETLKSIKDYVTREGVPEVINNRVSLRRKD
ncbi:MAG: hypothetical protein IJ073_02710, partial [Lachnospiraceae bacterium]|nr:hypothetical protein [Lachnospiraceae bacterium]